MSWAEALARLGFDVVFVEQLDPARGRRDGAPCAPASRRTPPRSSAAIERVGLTARGAARPATARGAASAREELLDRAASAALLVNISGHLRDPDLLRALPSRAFVDLDPGYTQIWHARRATTSAWPATTCTSRSAPTSARAHCDAARRRHPLDPPSASRSCSTAGRSATAASPASRRSASWRGAYGPLDWDGRTLRRQGPRVPAARRACRAACGLPFEIALDIASRRRRRPPRGCAARGWSLLPPETVATPAGVRRATCAARGAEFSVAQGVYVDTAQRLVQRSHRPLPGQRPPGARAGHRLRPHAAGRRGPADVPRRRTRRSRLARASWSTTTPATGAAARELAEELLRARAGAGAAARRPRGGAVRIVVAGHGRRRARPGRRRLGGAAVRARAAPARPRRAAGRAGRRRLEPAAPRLRRDRRRVRPRTRGAGRARQRAASPARRARRVDGADLLLNLSGSLDRRGPARALPTGASTSTSIPAFTQLWHAAEGIDLGLRPPPPPSSPSAARIGARRLHVPDCGRALDHHRRSRWCSTHWRWCATHRAPTSATTRRPLARLRLDQPRRRPLRADARTRCGQLLALPALTATPLELALAIHPGERDDLAALRRHGWRLLDPAAVAGDAGRLPRRSCAARGPSSASPSTATSPRAAAGSATAASATWPPGGRWSRRTPASATGCRPATGCSPYSTSDEAAAALDEVRARLPPPSPRGARARRGRVRLRPGAGEAAVVPVSDAELARGAGGDGGCGGGRGRTRRASRWSRSSSPATRPGGCCSRI